MEILVGSTPCPVYQVSVSDGVVDQKHLGLFEERWQRAKNWVAVIKPNRARPGGLDREFLPRAVGSRYHTNIVVAGDFIEVGADYVTTGGNKIPARRYFRILQVAGNTWTLRDCPCGPPEDSLDIPPLAPEVAALSAVEPGPDEEGLPAITSNVSLF